MAIDAKKVLIMGLSGAGKTTLANMLVPRLNGVHFNADAVRANVNKDLGFASEDRIEQARRMGWLCDRVVEAGTYAIADFICPTKKTREAFGDAFVVWIDRIKKSRFPDTDALFEVPERWDIRVGPDGSPAYWAEKVCEKLLPTFDPQAPTALFIGRYQPFQDGHKKLIEEGLKRVGQVCIAVRDTHGTDAKNPLAVLRGQGVHRVGPVADPGSHPGDPASQHHQRVLRPRRWLRGGAPGAGRGDGAEFPPPTSVASWRRRQNSCTRGRLQRRSASRRHTAVRLISASSSSRVTGTEYSASCRKRSGGK
jgi:hypothetical protein